MHAGRMVVPGMRIILDGLGSALFDARGRRGGHLAFVLLVTAQQLVQPTHEGSSSFVWIRRRICP